MVALFFVSSQGNIEGDLERSCRQKETSCQIFCSNNSKQKWVQWKYWTKIGPPFCTIDVRVKWNQFFRIPDGSVDLVFNSSYSWSLIRILFFRSIFVMLLYILSIKSCFEIEIQINKCSHFHVMSIIHSTLFSLFSLRLLVF